MSQAGVALKIGVSQSLISQIETGRASPGFDVVLSLAQVLDDPKLLLSAYADRLSSLDCESLDKAGKKAALLSHYSLLVVAGLELMEEISSESGDTTLQHDLVAQIEQIRIFLQGHLEEYINRQG